jgi:hypothetical protein
MNTAADTQEWWADLEEEALACLAPHGLSAAELGAKLGMSEASTASLIAMLAREGRVRLVCVERKGESRSAV